METRHFRPEEARISQGDRYLDREDESKQGRLQKRRNHQANNKQIRTSFSAASLRREWQTIQCP